MDNNQNDVNNGGATPAASTDESKQTPTVNQDVQNGGVVEKKVYEQVRNDMLKEREEKRKFKAENAALEQRIAKLEQLVQKGDDDDDDDKIVYTPAKAQSEIMDLMTRDPFVKDNLDLIEQKMSENPALTVNDAVKELKSDFFDRINKEATPQTNINIKQERPSTTTGEKPSDNRVANPSLDDALNGKIDIDPLQLEAIRRHLRR